MKLSFNSVIIALGLALTVLPSHAQLAYTRVARPIATSVDPEEAAKPTATRVLHGVVQDRQGVLPGATVWLHGTRTIVVTNAEGEFELRVPADAKQVSLTCGYAGLQEEVMTLTPVAALGSLYLLRAKPAAAIDQLTDKAL